MCNFGGGYHAEQFCEIILNFDEWFRCRLKDFLSRALAALMTIYAILVDGIMGNIPVKSFLFVTVVQERKSLRTTDETDHNSSP